LTPTQHTGFELVEGESAKAIPVVPLEQPLSFGYRHSLLNRRLLCKSLDEKLCSPWRSPLGFWEHEAREDLSACPVVACARGAVAVVVLMSRSLASVTVRERERPYHITWQTNCIAQVMQG
jgi:hypothetical protein